MSVDLERELEKFRNDQDPAKAGLAKILIVASRQWRSVYGPISLVRESAKPQTKAVASPETAQARETQAPKVNLRQRTYELLQLVVEPTAKEKEALRAKRGLVFLPMTPQSYVEVVAEDPNHFWDKELDYANARPALRDFRPPIAVDVGLRETDLALPGSFNKPRSVALRMIEEYSQQLATEFPGFQAIMLPATGYARADRTYAERNPGQRLFKNYFAWCLDDLFGVDAAGAGRGVLSRQFDVRGWYARFGYPYIGAVPAVVKIGSK